MAADSRRLSILTASEVDVLLFGDGDTITSQRIHGNLTDYY
jgi:hypothetical protein